MVWVLFCNGLCESKLWTQQFYHNTVAFIAEKRSFHPFSCTPDSLPRRGVISSPTLAALQTAE